MDRDNILKKLKTVNDLPTLSAFAIEVNRMADKGDRILSTEFIQLIEKDQAIAALIIQLANSAFFGFYGKATNVSMAIRRLGPYIVRDAVITIAIIKSFSALDLLKDFNAKTFWVHSISVALTARHLGGKMKIKTSEKCFISGLLHDIGKLILCAFFPDHFTKVWKRFRAEKIPFREAEKRELSTDHSKIGETLARIWKLPDHIVDAIGGHHDLPESASDLDVLKIIHFSDVIVNRHTVDGNDRTDRFKMHSEVRKEMAPYLESEEKWFPEVSKEIENARAIFLA